MTSVLPRAAGVLPADSRFQGCSTIDSGCQVAKGGQTARLPTRQFHLVCSKALRAVGRRSPCQRLACHSAIKTDQEDRIQHTDLHPSEIPSSSGLAEGSKLKRIEPHNSTSDRNPTEDLEQHSNGLAHEAALGGTVLAAAVILGMVAGVGGAGYALKDEITASIQVFEGVVQGLGPAGYVLFVLGYAGLELLAIPAIPLSMSAGLVFGVATGTILCSIAGTIAATGAFLIARYGLRERILALAKSNKKFLAIDRAVGNDSFRIVLLLRLSPLLPFSLGNYLYGITSVQLLPYVLASWVGMLPGTWAYVSAGSLGRSLLEEGPGAFQGSSEQLLSLGVGILATLGAGAYVTNVAKGALKETDEG